MTKTTDYFPWKEIEIFLASASFGVTSGQLLLIALSIIRNEVEEIMVIISIVDINSLCKSIYISIHLSMTSDADQAWVLWTLIAEELRPPK